MKLKQMLALCLLLCLTACQAPSQPGPVSAPVETGTETATELTGIQPVALTAKLAAEPAIVPLSAGTQPPPTPDYTPYFDSVNHPIHGWMGMTNMERAFTLAVENRDYDLFLRLMDDPRYPDICGGFYYHDGAMHLFAVDSRALNELVTNPTTAAGDPDPMTELGMRFVYHPTTVSLRRLLALYDQIDGDKAKYGVTDVYYQPRYNQLVAVPSSWDVVDPDLQQLADTERCIEIDPFYHTSEGISPLTALTNMLEFNHTDIYGGISPQTGGYSLRVTDTAAARRIIDADPEARLAYALMKNVVTLSKKDYSRKALDAALGGILETLAASSRISGGYTVTEGADGKSFTIKAKGASDLVTQRAARLAAMAAVQRATGQSGRDILLTFTDAYVEERLTTQQPMEFDAPRTTEGSPRNFVYAALAPHKDVFAGEVYIPRRGQDSDTVVYVYDLNRALELIRADEYAGTPGGYNNGNNGVRLVQVAYGLETLRAVQQAGMKALDSRVTGWFYSTYSPENAAITFHGQGVSNPAVMRAVTDAAYAVEREAVARHGLTLSYLFEEELVRPFPHSLYYAPSFLGGPSAGEKFLGPRA